MSGAVEIRRLRDEDDLEALTELLHRAYAPLAARGMRYVASWQPVETTRKRADMGECFVAESGGRVIGTISFYDIEHTRGCPWYDRDDVASLHQFAVDPEQQGAAVGSRLLATVEERARAIGAPHIALDTSEHAHELIAWYVRRGYVPVGDADWSSTNYRSVVLSKELAG